MVITKFRGLSDKVTLSTVSMCKRKWSRFILSGFSRQTFILAHKYPGSLAKRLLSKSLKISRKSWYTLSTLNEKIWKKIFSKKTGQSFYRNPTLTSQYSILVQNTHYYYIINRGSQKHSLKDLIHVKLHTDIR